MRFAGKEVPNLFVITGTGFLLSLGLLFLDNTVLRTIAIVGALVFILGTPVLAANYKDLLSEYITTGVLLATVVLVPLSSLYSPQAALVVLAFMVVLNAYAWVRLAYLFYKQPTVSPSQQVMPTTVAQSK
jgi:hypothetical protein